MATADAARFPSGDAAHETTVVFAALIRQHREARQMSQLALANRMGTDASMVLRVERRERFPRDRAWVEAAAVALELSEEETDDLLIAAGHVPAPVYRLAMARDPVLLAVARALADPRPAEAERARLRATLASVAAWYTQAAPPPQDRSPGEESTPPPGDELRATSTPPPAGGRPEGGQGSSGGRSGRRLSGEEQPGREPPGSVQPTEVAPR